MLVGLEVANFHISSVISDTQVWCLQCLTCVLLSPSSSANLVNLKKDCVLLHALKNLDYSFTLPQTDPLTINI